MNEMEERPFQEVMVESRLLEVSRNTYQRGLNPERVRRITKEFDERIANEPKVSLRNGHYYIFDGQHIVAARVERNSGESLPVSTRML